jgi:hypothetical protein
MNTTVSNAGFGNNKTTFLDNTNNNNQSLKNNNLMNFGNVFNNNNNNNNKNSSNSSNNSYGSVNNDNNFANESTSLLSPSPPSSTVENKTIATTTATLIGLNDEFNGNEQNYKNFSNNARNPILKKNINLNNNASSNITNTNTNNNINSITTNTSTDALLMNNSKTTANNNNNNNKNNYFSNANEDIKQHQYHKLNAILERNDSCDEPSTTTLTTKSNFLEKTSDSNNSNNISSNEYKSDAIIKPTTTNLKSILHKSKPLINDENNNTSFDSNNINKSISTIGSSNNSNKYNNKVSNDVLKKNANFDFNNVQNNNNNIQNSVNNNIKNNINSNNIVNNDELDLFNRSTEPSPSSRKVLLTETTLKQNEMLNKALNQQQLQKINQNNNNNNIDDFNYNTSNAYKNNSNLTESNKSNSISQNDRNFLRNIDNNDDLLTTKTFTFDAIDFDDTNGYEIQNFNSAENEGFMCFEYVSIEVIIVLMLYLINKTGQELSASSVPLLTSENFHWDTESSGYFMALLGALVLPTNIYISSFMKDFEAREMVLRLSYISLISAIIVLNNSFVKYSTFQYMFGNAFLFCILNALEGIIMALLSKLVSPELAKGTFNSGLLATEAGTFGRVLGDAAITFLGESSSRTSFELVNLLFFPFIAALFFSIIVIHLFFDRLVE